MPNPYCQRCPLAAHRRPCPAWWEGCGETCANATGPLRHDIITATDQEAFRALLPAAHFEREHLADEVITLFVPLSGRWEAWRTHLRPWLDSQTWPRAQTRLVLADTSQDDSFGMMVQGWAFTSDYPAPRYYTQAVGKPGLAEHPRSEGEVSRACSAIYTRMAAELTTRYVLIVEDDHRPAPGTVERLLRGFDDRTAAVSALYRGRRAGEWVVWPRDPTDLHPADGPAIPVMGTGFGTVIIQAEWLRRLTIGPGEPYDFHFCRDVQTAGAAWKLDRGCLSEHFGAPASPPPNPFVAQLAEFRRLDLLVNACPHRGCRTGCGNATCAVGKGDQGLGGTVASLMHCRACVSAPAEPSVADLPGAPRRPASSLP